MRAQCWQETDPKRTGIPEFIFHDDFSYSNWMNYLLDIPVYFLYRNSIYIEVNEITFRELIQNPQNHAPITLNDFITHASTVFPDVRLKNFIEMRGADSSTQSMLCALPAFWVGLLYNPKIQDQIYERIISWQHRDVLALRKQVISQGMNATIDGKSLYQLAEEILPLASTTLEQRKNGKDERAFLRPLEKIISKRETLSDHIRKLYQETNGDIQAIYQAYQF